MCNEFKDEKFVGFFMFGKSVLMVNDESSTGVFNWGHQLESSTRVIN